MARRRKSRRQGQLPKGAYRLPTGGYMTSSCYRSPSGKSIVIRGVVRDEPDAHKVALAVIELAGKRLLEAHEGQAEDDLKVA